MMVISLIWLLLVPICGAEFDLGQIKLDLEVELTEYAKHEASFIKKLDHMLVGTRALLRLLIEHASLALFFPVFSNFLYFCDSGPNALTNGQPHVFCSLRGNHNNS